MRQRGGRTLPFVFKKESEGVQAVRAHIPMGTTIHADEARGWDILHAHYDMRRVNHSVEYKSADGANSNQAESFFSRLRRAEIGIHHRVSGDYLERYSSEMAWREDHRRHSNGEQATAIAGFALRHARSAQFAGYWQRSRSRAA